MNRSFETLAALVVEWGTNFVWYLSMMVVYIYKYIGTKSIDSLIYHCFKFRLHFFK